MRKSLFEKGDTHPVGAEATVLGSAGPVPYQGEMVIGYFVVWDALPDVAVFVTSKKIERL